MKLPCKDGAYEMPADVEAAYRRLYPSADGEFAQMQIWLETHASRRPASAKSAPRFVANWFKRVPRARVSDAVREQRERTFAALTGRAGDSNVIDITAVTAVVGGTNLRPDGGGLWRAEALEYVDGQRSAAG